MPTSPSSTPHWRLAWKRRIARTGRWLHIYASMASFAVVLFFAITGLTLKAYSPLQPTFNIELANGAEGYIPPPEQHKLGGYTTWPARTAGLEVQAEPRIVEALLQLLEKVAARPRRCAA